MDGKRANTILLDLQSLLGLYELNREVFLDGLDVYLIGVLIHRDMGGESVIEHSSPEYRMVEDQSKASESCSDFICSLIEQLLSFTVTLILKIATNFSITLKFYISASYGIESLEALETINYTVDANVSNKNQNAFRNCVAEVFSLGKIETFADMIALIPEITNKLRDMKLHTMELPLDTAANSALHKKRSWIFSHHIYSNEKRKNMLDLARNGSLYGFCLPGKPGVVCIEGDADEVDNFWSRIRRWNWQRLQLVFSENYDCLCSKPSNLCDCAKFPAFSELILDNASSNKKQDMSEFVKFLNTYNCADAFEKLFGFEAK